MGRDKACGPAAAARGARDPAARLSGHRQFSHDRECNPTIPQQRLDVHSKSDRSLYLCLTHNTPPVVI